MNLIVSVLLCLFAASPYTLQQNVYDGGKTDKTHGICLDSANHVVIVGETNQWSDFDFWLITLEKSIDSLCSWFYDDGGDEKGFVIATTHEGSLAAAGPLDNGMRTILYATNGKVIWEKLGNDGEIMEVRAITVSPDSIIYALGYHLGGMFDYLVINGYEHDGTNFMYVDDRGDLSQATGIVALTDGRVYVGSNEGFCCAIWLFAAPEEQEWRTVYENESTRGFGLEINGANHLFQSGDVQSGGNNYDFLLLKWLPGETGATIMWPDSTHKAYDLGHNEYCRDIKLDAISDCYLAGWQVRGEEEDAALIKTDSAGNMLWSWVDTLEGKQQIEGIEVDEEGYIYLAGSHHNGSNWDMLVAKIRQPLTISGRVTDSAGAPMASTPIKLTGDTLIEVVSDTDGFYEIEVYNGGSYTVSPDLPGWVFTPSSHTYDPLSHREFNQDFEDGYFAGIKESEPSTPTNLEVTFSEIHYTLPGDRHGTLSIYDPSGQLVNRMQVTGSGSVEFSKSLPSGVYLVQLRTKHNTVIRKALILR